MAKASWHAVAQTSELVEGNARVVKISERVLAVGRVGTRFYAVDNTCPHAGGSLGEGDIEEDSIICPLHAWAFDVFTGKCSTGNKTLATYPTRVTGTKLEVSF